MYFLTHKLEFKKQECVVRIGRLDTYFQPVMSTYTHFMCGINCLACLDQVFAQSQAFKPNLILYLPFPSSSIWQLNMHTINANWNKKTLPKAIVSVQQCGSQIWSDYNLHKTNRFSTAWFLGYFNRKQWYNKWKTKKILTNIPCYVWLWTSIHLLPPTPSPHCHLSPPHTHYSHLTNWIKRLLDVCQRGFIVHVCDSDVWL